MVQTDFVCTLQHAGAKSRMHAHRGTDDLFAQITKAFLHSLPYLPVYYWLLYLMYSASLALAAPLSMALRAFSMPSPRVAAQSAT